MEVALSIPDSDSFGIRNKVSSELTLDDLKKENDITILIAYMDSIFKKDELSEVYERYVAFDRYKKDSSQKMDDFILEFERRYYRAKQEMELPQAVLAFKLLDPAQVEQKDRQLVLTGVDYSKKTELFDQMKSSLK